MLASGGKQYNLLETLPASPLVSRNTESISISVNIKGHTGFYMLVSVLEMHVPVCLREHVFNLCVMSY